MSFLKQSYVYKRVEDCPLYADVYRLEDSQRRPAILWLHGGGLIFGDRKAIPLEQVNLYLAAGYTVVSVDYRLAPETKLEQILADVQDAYSFIQSQGPELFGIDPECITVIGHSAGAYLALMMGSFAVPKPKSIVSFYGYGDISKEWSHMPDPHYVKEPLVSKEAAYSGVGNRVLTGSVFTGFSDKRWLFYLFCRQQGLWFKEVTGYDLSSISQNRLNALSPVRNVSSDYPPTLLLHGDKDTDVACDLSIEMASMLEKQRVRHELFIVEGLGHVFDRFPDPTLEGSPAGLKHPKVSKAFDIVLQFLTHEQ